MDVDRGSDAVCSSCCSGEVENCCGRIF